MCQKMFLALINFLCLHIPHLLIYFLFFSLHLQVDFEITQRKKNDLENSKKKKKRKFSDMGIKTLAK